jgi:thiamine-phosphate pyrophosphorylase
MQKAARIQLFQEIDVYPVTCERLSEGRSNLEVLRAVIRGGSRIIQLREKEYAKRDLFNLALKFRKIATQARILLIINDHLDIALAVDADGVHLGQEDLPVQVAREMAPDLLIGASTHSLEQALEAEKHGADYINIGPIFSTKTKEGVESPLGPEAITEISRQIVVPFTVMGGISEANIDQVLARGARRVAMVSAITKAEEIAKKVTFLKEKIRLFPNC